jgi:hypothetical protein
MTGCFPIFPMQLLPSLVQCTRKTQSFDKEGWMMVKTVTRLMMAAAAASMVVMPIAAQANTRAGDSGSVYRVAAAPGLARTAEGESVRSGFSIILALLAAAASIGGVILATTSDDKGQSPGT